MLYHGWHVSGFKSYYNAVKNVNKTGAKACQVFLRSPQMVNQLKSKMDPKDAKKTKEFIQKHDMKIVVHSPYTVNFAHHPKTDVTNKMINIMLDEFKCAEQLGASGCIIHMGKYHTKDEKIDYNVAIDNKIKNIESLLRNVKKAGITGVKLILETAAGQGSELCYKLKMLATLYNSINEKYQPMIGFCIDTCHIFSAGYDIRTSKKATKYLKRFDKCIGLNKVEVIHFNDSKVELKERNDRHQVIGIGYICSEKLGGSLFGMAEFARFAYLKGIPIILETPGYVEPQLAMIESMSGAIQS